MSKEYRNLDVTTKESELGDWIINAFMDSYDHNDMFGYSDLKLPLLYNVLQKYRNIIEEEAKKSDDVNVCGRNLIKRIDAEEAESFLKETYHKYRDNRKLIEEAIEVTKERNKE